MNLGALLNNAALKYPERPAVVSEEGRFTFKAFDRRTDRVAGAMLGAGLKKGDRVGLLFFNSSYFAEAYFGSVKAGLVVTPVNFRFVGPEITYVLNDSQPRILFYGPEFEQTVLDIREQLETVELFISPHSGDSSLAVSYEDFLAGGAPIGVEHPVEESDRCQIMYTSGTTGRPKGAVLTHGNVLWNLFNTIWGREDKSGERAVIVGPLYHTAALNNHFTIQIALGGTSILVRKFEPESLLRIIEKEKATVVSGVPALYNQLLLHPKAHEYDTSSITKCTSGSDNLHVMLMQELFELFHNIKGIYDIYGCTEASPSITILKAEDSLRKHGSVGKALPFLAARVVDDRGQVLPPGEVGELICRGPNVMLGYHGNPEETRATLRDGWLHTGDLARMDEEGFFYIVDRKNDMILSGGENIYPREVEEVLVRHPAVADVAVIGVADPHWGESVKAFVALKEGQEAGERDIIDFCKRYLASYKKPKSVVFIPSIPRNPSGKVLKKLLREKY